MKYSDLAGLCILLMLWSNCSQDSKATFSDFTSIPQKIDFNFHVKPILSDRCFACHGPDENAREANLRLDLESHAFAALDSLGEHFAIVPGDTESSELIKKIISNDPEEIMPPPESNLELNDQEIEILKKWIEQGAEWKEHWAFSKPQQPQIPEFSNNSWVSNPIDNFILAKLELEGLKTSKEASKEKLIRRLSFDLRGLPPTIKEIDDFLSDTSPDAFEKLVDDFLSQKSYGERLSMEWLDLARYADSHGYQDDIERSMWPWRDWVIDAFNQNMPYNDFVATQLAGDLMPDATYEQKLATGFNRNHKITQEVGVIDEEYRVTYVLDRVNTFSTAFMGLTAECAQCHDHKYDPITMKDYYGLFSFFNKVPERGRVDYGVEVAAPALPLPDEKIEEIRNYVSQLEEAHQDKYQSYVDKKWEEGIDEKLLTIELASTSDKLPSSLINYYPLDYIEGDQFYETTTKKSATVYENVLTAPGKVSGSFEFMGKNYGELPAIRSLNFNNPHTISFWIKSLDGGIRGPVLTFLDKNGKKNFYCQITSRKEVNVFWQNTRNKTNFNLLTRDPLAKNKWIHVAIVNSGSRKSGETKLFIDGNPVFYYTQSKNLAGPIKSTQKIFLGNDGGNFGLSAGQLDEMMVFDKALSDEEVKDVMNFNGLPEILAKQVKSEDDLKRLFFHQLSTNDPIFQSSNQILRDYRIRKGRTEDIVVKPTMIMKDEDSIRATYILERGQYDAPGDTVLSGTPPAIMDFPNNLKPNRLGLANWLFDPENPLTARVAVNRYWQMIFGKGIVATPGDFGSQGALPSHPDLLDWLALEFLESGWDLKKLLKTMVMSSTYKQSVNTNEKLQRRDPENSLLARGPQSRLPAEMIRDHALASGGLLSQYTGGPSVKPYQPEGLWLEVASGNQSLRKYIQDHGDELYRRSLYTFWKRTVPPPSMIIFDAPSREQCTIKRRATSTPMQALVMLNDPQFVEASRLLGLRMLKNNPNASLENKLTFGFRLVTSRAPKKEELKLLIDLFNKEKSNFEVNQESAKQLLEIGESKIEDNVPAVELATYTVIANTILNLTEAVMKG
jgi:hypothetical protein